MYNISCIKISHLDQRLTNNSATDHGPSWSPDGLKIVFHSDRDGDHEIYVMNTDGSNPTNITNNTFNNSKTRLVDFNTVTDTTVENNYFDGGSGNGHCLHFVTCLHYVYHLKTIVSEQS